MASKSLMEWLMMLWVTWRTSAWCNSSRVVLCALPSVVYRCSLLSSLAAGEFVFLL
jgi:hypothetical protein